MSDPRAINPFEDAGYWADVRREQREDSRCSECGGFDNPVYMEDRECRCPEALAVVKEYGMYSPRP